MDKFKYSKSYQITLKVGAGYMALGLLWMFFSDKLLDAFNFSSDSFPELQTYKDFFFVVVSSVFFILALYLTNSKLRNRINNLKEFFELNADPVIVLGYFDFEVINFNKTFSQLFKYSAENKFELVDLILSDEQFNLKQFKKKLSSIRSGKTGKFRWIFKNQNNENLDFDIVAKSAVYKNRDVVILFLKNIKNADEILSDKKAFLEKTFEHIPVGIHILKKEGNKYHTLYANKEIKKILGLEEINQEGFKKIKFHNSDSGDLKFQELPFIKIVNGEIDYYDGDISIVSNKKISDILLRSSIVKDCRDESSICVSVFRDATCIKKTENEYKNYEAKYRTLFETSPEAILIIKADTKEIVDFNKKALYLFKLKTNEMIGKSFYTLNPEKQFGKIGSAEKIDRYIQASVQGGTPYFEWQHKNKHNELIFCEVSMAKLPSTEGDFIKCTIVDISDRNLAEDMLNKTEKIYQEVISSVTNNITVHNASDGSLLEGNNTFYDIFGYYFEDIRNKTATEIYSSEGKYDIESFEEKIKIAKEQKELRFRWKSFTKEKKDIWLDLLLKYIEMEEGEGRIIAISKNVNEIVGVQKELVALTRSLKEKNEEFRHLLYKATHDLRTPLLNILGFSNELKLNYEEMLTYVENEANFNLLEFREFLSRDCGNDIYTIVENTKKMSALINGLIELSRIETIEIQKEDINVFHLVNEIKKNLIHKIEKTNVEIIINNLPVCYSDRYKLHLVFTNLIDNAIKFRNKNINSFVKISGEIRENRFYYFVEDNGIGIEDKNMNRIIEMFYRNDPEAAEGAGLGLSIVEKSLEAIGGNLSVESIRGKGSRFTISIPDLFRV